MKVSEEDRIGLCSLVHVEKLDVEITFGSQVNLRTTSCAETSTYHYRQNGSLI
jgi:hypothetical protein